MVTEAQVRAAESQIGQYSWGTWPNPLEINGQQYPIEWIETGDQHEEGNWTTQLEAVFKININGFDRYFVKNGVYRSHDGEYWDGAFYEATPQTVTKTEYQPGTTVVRLTADEVESALKEYEDFYWDELDWIFRDDKDNTLTVNGRAYKVEVLEQEGSGEWAYDTRVVFKVGDQVFKKTGHFQSHYGNDWDGPLQEVHLVEKTVKVWEAK